VTPREALRVLRVLVLGETRVLPVAVAVTVAIAAAVRLGVGESRFADAGAVLVVGLVVASLSVSLRAR
jgi:hypothetical protein